MKHDWEHRTAAHVVLREDQHVPPACGVEQVRYLIGAKWRLIGRGPLIGPCCAGPCRALRCQHEVRGHRHRPGPACVRSPARVGVRAGQLRGQGGPPGQAPAVTLSIERERKDRSLKQNKAYWKLVSPSAV